ncbi:hypothetical protein VDGL01_04037 [Verticillium dahliae]
MAMGANVGALLCCLAALQNSQNSVQTGCTFPLRDGAPLSLIARKNGRMQRTAMAGAHGTISQARSSKGPERPNTHSQQAIQPRPWRTHQLLTGCLVDGELSSFRDTVVCGLAGWRAGREGDQTHYPHHWHGLDHESSRIQHACEHPPRQAREKNHRRQRHCGGTLGRSPYSRALLALCCGLFGVFITLPSFWQANSSIGIHFMPWVQGWQGGRRGYPGRAMRLALPSPGQCRAASTSA